MSLGSHREEITALPGGSGPAAWLRVVPRINAVAGTMDAECPPPSWGSSLRVSMPLRFLLFLPFLPILPVTAGISAVRRDVRFSGWMTLSYCFSDRSGIQVIGDQTLGGPSANSRADTDPFDSAALRSRQTLRRGAVGRSGPSASTMPNQDRHTGLPR